MTTRFSRGLVRELLIPLDTNRAMMMVKKVITAAKPRDTRRGRRLLNATRSFASPAAIRSEKIAVSLVRKM